MKIQDFIRESHITNHGQNILQTSHLVFILISNMFMYIIIQIGSITISKPNSEEQVYILDKIKYLTKSHNKAFQLKAKQTILHLSVHLEN